VAGARPDGGGWSPRFLVRSVEVAGDGTCAEVAAADDEAGLALVTRLRLHPSGVLEAGHTLRNLGDGPYLIMQPGSACPCRPGRWSCST
jgi:alpha-galactosidase